MYAPSKQMVDFYVRGFRYWDGALVLGELKPGMQLLIEPEFDNPFDSNALALYAGESKLGYVPAGLNEGFATMLFYGHAGVFEARVLQVTPDAAPHQQVRVGIFVMDAREDVQE